MIIPSVDLQDNKAVQLQQGREKMLENKDPVGLAKEFNFYSELAVIDLDAAIKTDGTNNEDVIAEIAKKTDCRVGGGIRTVEKAERIIGLGAAKVIIGTSAFKDGKLNTVFLNSLKKAVGRNRIILAVDTYNGELVTHGWRNKSGIKLLDIAAGLEPYANELLFTCVEKEGMLQGADLKQVKALKSKTNLIITAAGGITTNREVAKLSEIRTSCQLGMAIYTGRMKLTDAAVSSLNWKHGSVPTILTNENGHLLGLVYSSRKSFQQLVETRKAVFYNKQTKKIYEHSSLSGAELVKLRNGCRNESIQIVIKTNNSVCDTGNESCYGSIMS